MVILSLAKFFPKNQFNFITKNKSKEKNKTKHPNNAMQTK